MRYDRMMWFVLALMVGGFVAGGVWLWMWSGDWGPSTWMQGARQAALWGLGGSAVLFGATYGIWKRDNRRNR